MKSKLSFCSFLSQSWDILPCTYPPVQTMCSNDQRVDIIVGSLYREQNYNQRTGLECVGNTILCPDVHALQQGASVTFLVTEACQAKIVLFVQRIIIRR